MAKNTNSLKESNHEFFVHIFWEAEIGSKFLFLETTHRILSNMYNAAIFSGFSLRINPCCCHTTTHFKEFRKSDHESRYLGLKEKGEGIDEG